MSDYFFEHPAKMFILILVAIVAFVFGFGWYASCKEAEVLNKFSDVQVSCSDVFWAGDSITSQDQTIKLR